MSLLQKAFETYNANEHIVGFQSEGLKEPLVPIYHIIQQAQIEIHLDINGKFISASKVEKNDAYTIFPVSEESANRTSSIVAHPLSDKLVYVSTIDVEKHKAYLKAIGNWAESPFTHPYVQAVYAYVLGETIVKDLKKSEVIKTAVKDGKKTDDTNSHLSDIIRWVIHDGEEEKPCWQETALFDCYIEYYRDQLKDAPKALCMMTGKMLPFPDKYPKGIMRCAYNPKIISFGDETGYSYLGKFKTKEEALTLGVEPVQKAMNALRFITTNLGVVIDGRVTACWSPHNLDIPSPMNAVFDSDSDDEPIYERAQYRKKVRDTLWGYREDLPDDESVSIVVFDAPTDGRLSVLYYNELQYSDYMDRIESWYDGCSWDSGKLGIRTPSLNAIVAAAYGIERGNKIEVNDSILKYQTHRLLHCITDHANIPTDLVLALVEKASSPRSHKATWNKLMNIACAVVRMWLNQKEDKEVWELEFDELKHTDDRSYQFGRLLAIFDKVERDTFDKDKDRGRETGATRLWTQYRARPLRFADVLRRNLEPYITKTNRNWPGSRVRIERTINEVMDNIISIPESELDKPLSPTYLLGYYAQRNLMYSKRNVPEIAVGETEENVAENAPKIGA